MHLSRDQLQAGLDQICASPKDEGVLNLIVRRPEIGGREVLEVGALDQENGLVGDNWRTRGSSSTADGSAHPDKQLNIMSSRVIDLLARDRDRWQLAGDQLYVDFDLSEANVPAGTRLAVGSAIVEVTEPPHTGCHKFTARFGVEATRFVNSTVGRKLHLRGVCARVVQSGSIRVGDVVRKLTGAGGR